MRQEGRKEGRMNRATVRAEPCVGVTEARLALVLVMQAREVRVGRRRKRDGECGPAGE